MKKVEFNIKENMSAQDILKEIEGKVSGETIQEVAVLKDRLKGDPKTEIFFDPIREYSLVRVEEVMVDCFNLTKAKYMYYLSGITDEGFYFFHELEGNLIRGFKSMERLLDWVNKTDLGFAKRIQGDILLQYVKPRYNSNGRNVSEKMFWQEVQKPDNDCEIEINIPDYGSLTIRKYDIHDNYRDTSTIDIGNHKIIANHVYRKDTRDGLNVIILDSAAKLQHPQHGLTDLEIPKGHAAVLTHQRGRTGVTPID